MNDHPNNLPEIEMRLRSFALNERVMALNQLAKLDSSLAVPALERLAAEKDFMFRRLAVMGLANHPVDASFVVLQGLIDRESDHSVLAEAANSIFEFGDRSIPILLSIFERSSHWLVRQTVISILVETDHYDALFQVATEALQDETQIVKEAGISAMARIWRSPLAQPAFELVKAWAADEFWRNRWRAAIALSGCTVPESRELLAKLQTDDHYRVVAAALESMA